MTNHPPDRRVIRLFPDYGRDWPLWENSTPTWDVGYATSPETYGLTASLAARLKAWNTFWGEHFDPFEGWDDDANHEIWGVDGEGIAAQLRDEVASFADVRYEAWPLKSPPPGVG